MTTAVSTPEKHARIRQLDSQLANQIAAGEVIERPASVLKELLENSLDAGATQITIKVEQGGMRALQVTDNGVGIVKADLALALQRHATSKLSSSNQLQHIATLGFRGEALASMASVAKLQLLSRAAGSEQAWQISYDPEAKILQGPDPVGHAQGTTVMVSELFYTVPARKHFLRSVRTEYAHIEELVKRIALARPDLGLQLFHQHKLTLNYPAAGTAKPLLQRCQQVLGKAFLQHAEYVDNAVVGLSLQGYVGKAEFARSQADLQYLYVNGRMIRDKLLTHAVRQAYESQLYPGKFPQYLLYLQVDLGSVDVNVHPTKHEVRFRQSRLVHDFVAHSIQTTLTSLPAAAVEGVKPAEPKPEPEIKPVQQPRAAEEKKLAPSTALNRSASSPPSRQQPVRAAIDATTAWQHYQLPEQAAVKSHNAEKQASLISPVVNKQTVARQSHATTAWIMAVGNSFLLTKHQQALLFINVHAMMAQLAQQAFASGEVQQQPLLIPKTVTLSPEQCQQLLDAEARLSALGLDIGGLSTTQLVLRGLPAVLKHCEAALLLQQLADLLSQNNEESMFMAKLACFAAPKEIQALSAVERQSVAQVALESYQQHPHSCAHWRCSHGTASWHYADEAFLQGLLT